MNFGHGNTTYTFIYLYSALVDCRRQHPCRINQFSRRCELDQSNFDLGAKLWSTCKTTVRVRNSAGDVSVILLRMMLVGESGHFIRHNVWYWSASVHASFDDTVQQASRRALMKIFIFLVCIIYYLSLLIMISSDHYHDIIECLSGLDLL